MKNNSGLTTRFAKPAKPTNWAIDTSSKGMTTEEFNREYVASFAPSDTYAFIKPSDIQAPPDRDTPESAVDDAW